MGEKSGQNEKTVVGRKKFTFSKKKRLAMDAIRALQYFLLLSLVLQRVRAQVLP
jgi:hypothetical protein